MRLAFLGSTTSWYLGDLRRAAAGIHEIVPVAFGQIAAELGPARAAWSSGGFDLCSADALLVRTMPPGTLEQVVFRMDALARIEAAGTPVINPPPAVEAAVDKYLALA